MLAATAVIAPMVVKLRNRFATFATILAIEPRSIQPKRMLHILAFTLAFPAICAVVVLAPGGFQIIEGVEALLLVLWVAYAATILPGLIAGIADYVLLRRHIRFRFLYCALVAAIISPIVGMWQYPGTPYYYGSNFIFYASVGAITALLCSLLIGGARSLLGIDS